MTELRRGDSDLHYPDGSHRATPPTADGHQLELWHARITRHMAEHALSEDASQPAYVGRPVEDRLAQVQPRVLYPVYHNKYEPELVSIHWTKTGAEAKLAHLLEPWCGDDDCYHDDTNDGHVFIGTPIEIQP